MELLWVRVDLEVIAMKGYSTFFRSSELKPYFQVQFNALPKTPLWWRKGLPLRGEYSQCILSPTAKVVFIRWLWNSSFLKCLPANLWKMRIGLALKLFCHTSQWAGDQPYYIHTSLIHIYSYVLKLCGRFKVTENTFSSVWQCSW